MIYRNEDYLRIFNIKTTTDSPNFFFVLGWHTTDIPWVKSKFLSVYDFHFPTFLYKVRLQ